MTGAIAFLVGILIDCLGLYAEAWLVEHPWRWFAVPALHVPALSLPAIAGLIVIVSIAKVGPLSRAQSEWARRAPWMEVFEFNVTNRITTLMAIAILTGFGWAIHAWWPL